VATAWSSTGLRSPVPVCDAAAEAGAHERYHLGRRVSAARSDLRHTAAKEPSDCAGCSLGRSRRRLRMAAAPERGCDGPEESPQNAFVLLEKEVPQPWCAAEGCGADGLEAPEGMQRKHDSVNQRQGRRATVASWSG
jgi:hypothetical protein